MLRPTAISKSSPRSKGSAAEELYGVRFTHPDRVVFEDVGITKRDLANYCAAVAEWMLPHLIHRPLTLVRCPEGMGKPCFYQKQPPQGLPASVKRLSIRFKEGPSVGVYVEDLQGLLALIQFGVLEIHAWQASVDQIERPDRIVFDLDPGPDVPWSRVVDAAVMLRDSLKELSLASFVKSTGGKGLHIVVPIEPQRPWSEVKEFSKAMAQALVVADPNRYTLSMSKGARPGKIFIDYLRNERGATAVVAYSPRARPGAPISLPLDWKELPKTHAGNSATVDNVLPKLKRRSRDPWKDLQKTRQSISDEAMRAVLSVQTGTIRLARRSAKSARK
ncbi:MAG TPA: non-homologous end-joining DNA ligase [Planctomycetaceae bacterium]|jgi:bifunctional non-homologous end joining protein LigD|nr:non-homologous end-joining DNA ligase [Planctomycetaceae bacterium]